VQNRKTKSAQRQSKLASQLHSSSMIIAAICFYVHHLSKKGSQVSAPSMDAKTPMPYYPWKHHMEAARRVAGVWRVSRKTTSLWAQPQSNDQRVYQMRANWQLRLKTRIELDPWTTEFKMLNPDLILDEAIERYAQENPVLHRTRQYLLKAEERIAKEAQEPRWGEYGQEIKPITVMSYMSPDMRQRLRRTMGGR
jgi:hypothetical protein